MIINHNMSSMNAHRQMIGNTANSGKSMEKLSSGLRINRAGDDAAGLAISEKMRGQIRGLDQATRNSQDGISLIQTAEGALNETHSILQRMRELAVQASNDTNNTSDRGQIQKEINQLTSEINRIGNTTEFNTMKLLNGEKSAEHITGSSIDTRSFISAGTKDVFTALGVSKTGTSSLALAGNITIGTSSGDGFDWTDLSANSGISTLTISKNTSGQLEVTIHAVNSAATNTLDTTDKIDVAWDASGKMTINSANLHGISFTINKTDFDNAGAGTGTTVIDLFKANNNTANASGAAISTNNSWTTNAAGAKISGGISLAPSITSSVGSAAASIQISMGSAAAGTSSIGSLTVKILNASGSVIMSDFITSGDTSSIDYNNNGISFHISNGGNSGTSATLSFDLADYKKTSAITLYDKQDDSLTFQVGANQAQSMSVAIDDMRANALKITSTAATAGFTSGQTVTDGTNNTNVEYALDVTTAANATKNITVIQTAMDKVSDARAKLGAYQNRLEHTIANLGTSSENLQAAESRIRDVDMAKEMSTFSKNNILAQAAQAMLAQANQQPQQVLQLLR